MRLWPAEVRDDTPMKMDVGTEAAIVAEVCVVKGGYHRATRALLKMVQLYTGRDGGMCFGRGGVC